MDEFLADKVPQYVRGGGKVIRPHIPARKNLFDRLVDVLNGSLSWRKGPYAANLVMARSIDANHGVYLKISDHDQKIHIKGSAKSILKGNEYSNQFALQAYEPECIEM